MKKFLMPAAMIVLSLGLFSLGGCAVKSGSPQQDAFKAATSECKSLANSMIGAESYGGGDSIIWNSYFQTCMEGKGYTKADLNKIWY